MLLVFCLINQVFKSQVVLGTTLCAFHILEGSREMDFVGRASRCKRRQAGPLDGPRQMGLAGQAPLTE